MPNYLQEKPFIEFCRIIIALKAHQPTYHSLHFASARETQLTRLQSCLSHQSAKANLTAASA